ncbi:hypothetical protein PoB_004174700 [Plakobranchus ocellatus]|uniref:Uncharacterized protein n=1 Tax=Plakobranchus ocellatus TaxID=259542 RepID=A0AAV4B814_9GAST|nr:hypothetical protein PoB_004174700 [Plakobranchus ocellatus]
MKSIGLSLVSCLGLLALDLTHLLSLPANSTEGLTLWTLPAWKAVLLTGLVLAVVLKVVQTAKGPDKLPMMSEAEKPMEKLSLPLLSNCITVFTFLVACTQGPDDPTLHDLWCCGSSMILACLQKDSLLLSHLTKGERQVAPTIAASSAVLSLATLARSRLWWSHWPAGIWSLLGGVFEVILVLLLAPIFYCTWVLLWKAEVVSEPAVVFLTPYSVLLVLLASCYTAWVLAVAALVTGVWMMMYRLPMVPYSLDPTIYYR